MICERNLEKRRGIAPSVGAESVALMGAEATFWRIARISKQVAP